MWNSYQGVARPVLEEEKKGEEEKEEEEEKEKEAGRKGEKNKGNDCKGKVEEEETKIRTFCESRKPVEIQEKPSNAAADGDVENAEVQKENNVNPPSAKSWELEKKSRLCTGAGAEVEVHRWRKQEK